MSSESDRHNKGDQPQMVGRFCCVHCRKDEAAYIILMPVSTATAKMLYRNLLYTAISRARKEVILVGSREAVNTAMQCIPYPRKSKLVARTNLLRLRRSA